MPAARSAAKPSSAPMASATPARIASFTVYTLRPSATPAPANAPAVNERIGTRDCSTMADGVAPRSTAAAARSSYSSASSPLERPELTRGPLFVALRLCALRPLALFTHASHTLLSLPQRCLFPSGASGVAIRWLRGCLLAGALHAVLPATPISVLTGRPLHLERGLPFRIHPPHHAKQAKLGGQDKDKGQGEQRFDGGRDRNTREGPLPAGHVLVFGGGVEHAGQPETA